MCNCRGGVPGPRRNDVIGWEYVAPDGTRSPAPFLTVDQARAEVRRRGGGTIREVRRTT